MPAQPPPDESRSMHEALRAVLAAHPGKVAAWLRNEPGAWGYLAGQAVLAERRRRGRPLSDAERRAVWQALWDMLTFPHRQPPPSP
jgi:hypothetical protein